jgi:hypothetical protein
MGSRSKLLTITAKQGGSYGALPKSSLTSGFIHIKIFRNTAMQKYSN